MKIFEILQINSLKEKIENKKMPIKTAYKFNKFFIEIQKDVNFFNSSLQNIIKEYGKKDEKGNYVLTDNKNGVIIQEDKYNECMNKIQELNNIEPEFSYIPSFKIDELEFLELSMSELSLLMPFIEEE